MTMLTCCKKDAALKVSRLSSKGTSSVSFHFGSSVFAYMLVLLILIPAKGAERSTVFLYLCA